jgi:4-cresol dehydrogenase (hydroxylating)
MEVVLANGEVVRTGMGALPNSKSWQHNRWGYGPWVDGLFRQGNMGVVTKMGFHLMPRPEAMQSATVRVTRAEDAVPLIDTLNLLENQHVVNGSTQLGGTGANWSVQIPIYGPEKVVRAQMEYSKEKFAKIAGSTFTEGQLVRTDNAAAMANVRKVNFGIPDLSTFGMLGRAAQGDPNASTGHMGFSPILPRTGEGLMEFAQFYRDNLPAVSENGALRFQGPVYMTNWDRTLVALIMFPVGKDKAMNAKMRAAFEKWVHLCAERGWGEYRTPAVFQDAVAKAYSFNNHSLTRMRETIKDALDPNGILSPGRYGVWPKRLRKA